MITLLESIRIQEVKYNLSPIELYNIKTEEEKRSYLKWLNAPDNPMGEGGDKK